MVSMTVQQRDILQTLLRQETPATLADLGTAANLTARQVVYRLTGVKAWLEQHHVRMDSRPGVGYTVVCTPAERRALLVELQGASGFNLTLTAGQRMQLLALKMLTTDEPIILKQIQQWITISRATVLKDINLIEPWLLRFDLQLERRPNYGFLVQGEELAKRQALVALLWGNTPFPDPLFKITYDAGLRFALAEAASFLPIVAQVQGQLLHWNVRAAFEWVAQTEVQMRGRFADNAVVHLALALAVQHERVNAGKLHTGSAEELFWLQKQPLWAMAQQIAAQSVALTSRLQRPDTIPLSEIAFIAMHLAVSIRNEQWPGEPFSTPELETLIEMLLENISQALFEPGLRHDQALREGLLAHLGPALMRQWFNLWVPPSLADQEIARECFREFKLAQELATVVEEQSTIVLSPADIDTITLLLHAAFVRARPERHWRIFVICPSGMATAQLLAARLKTRFPNLEILGVLSQRELSSERAAQAHFLVSTAPIESPPSNIQVIKVHPLLLPQDIAAISRHLNG